MILSNVWKNICGWTNYSDIVTSHKMMETEIGNRGSKSSDNKILLVKEQRINGNKFDYLMMSNFRCILMGFERNYLTEVLSKRKTPSSRFYYSTIQAASNNIVNKHLSSNILPKTFNPWFITGFIDGEGYFSIGISKNKNKVGWQVKLEFGISLHEKDRALLEDIQKYFSAGDIFIHPTQKIIKYRVLFKDLEKIIKHFDQYPLMTKKLADFELFRLAYKLVLNKEHLKLEGLKKIVALKTTMNKGLSDQLQAAFQDLIFIPRPLVENKCIPDSGWIAGFATAEGCFFVNIQKSVTTKSGVNIQLEFNISQHKRDEQLVANLVKFLGCGNTYIKGNICRFRVTNLTNIIVKILPFFKVNFIQGEKLKDFEDFCKVVQIVKDKNHLTQKGLDKIREIKARMNTGRN